MILRWPPRRSGRLRTSAALVAMLWGVSACSLLPDKPERLVVDSIVASLPDTPHTNLPLPSGVALLPVKWTVLSSKIGDKQFACQGDFVYIALTPPYYENLSRNNAELLRWVTEAAWQLRYYQAQNRGPRGHINDNINVDNVSRP